MKETRVRERGQRTDVGDDLEAGPGARGQQERSLARQTASSPLQRN